jgi:hypothetical protein
MELDTIGIDLSKTVFHLVGLNRVGEVVVRRRLSRTQLLRFTGNRIDRRIFDHSLGFVCADALILFGVARDLLVDRRIHKVYLIALPLIVIFHASLVYVWRAAPAWWLHLAQSILR